MLQIIDIKIKKLKTHVPIFCPKNNKLSLGQKKKKKKKKPLALLTSVGLGYRHGPGINTGINILCALGPI
jgi:hypothetical protein